MTFFLSFPDFHIQTFRANVVVVFVAPSRVRSASIQLSFRLFRSFVNRYIFFNKSARNMRKFWRFFYACLSVFSTEQREKKIQDSCVTFSPPPPSAGRKNTRARTNDCQHHHHCEIKNYKEREKKEEPQYGRRRRRQR